jgi:hypothetical protein
VSRVLSELLLESNSELDFFDGGEILFLNLGHLGGSLFRKDGGPEDGPEDSLLKSLYLGCIDVRGKSPPSLR